MNWSQDVCMSLGWYAFQLAGAVVLGGFFMFLLDLDRPRRYHR